MNIHGVKVWGQAQAILLGLAIGLASGCAKPPPPPPPPTVIQGSLSADAAVNPDGSGRPSPIVVRVLELKAVAGFNSGDFFSLWDHPKETLGADLVASEEYDLRPGEQKKFERMPPPETKYIAVIAAYRDLERATWRSVLPVAANQTQAIAVGLEARKVTMSRK